MGEPIKFFLALAFLSGLYAATLRAQTIDWSAPRVDLTLDK